MDDVKNPASEVSLTDLQHRLDAGDFGGARAALNDAFASRSKSPVYFHNLGLIDLKEGKASDAYVHFGMASARTQDPSVEAGLTAAERILAAQGRPLAELDPTSDALIQLGERLPMATLSFASTGVFFVAVAALVIAGLRKRVRTWMGAAVGALFFATLGTLILAFWVSAYRPAWVVEEAMARTGPGSSFLEVRKVPVGTKLRLVRKERGWLRVRLDRQGSEGYLPESSLLFWENDS